MQNRLHNSDQERDFVHIPILGPLICLMKGHIRSRSNAIERDGVYHSICKRCGTDLMQDHRREWLTPREYRASQERRDERTKRRRKRSS